jgi:hypothetical protein
MMIRNLNARQKEIRALERRARKQQKLAARQAARQQRGQGGNLNLKPTVPGGR